MIACDGLCLRQGGFRLDGLAFAIPDGAYAVLMGDTGCGKTSLVEALCGLRPIRSGSIHIGGVEVTRLPPGARGLGYVPQDGALFPTMDVAAHLAFAPQVQGWEAARIRARVAELAARLEITALLGRRIQGLSGGERQRVALGRALATRPRALLLDEPLAAVDEGTRERMCTLLTEVCREHQVTVLHVTHSRAEADRLADLRLRFADGRITETV
jgi:molybdate/tungstate transport system ATP-binding protein